MIIYGDIAINVYSVMAGTNWQFYDILTMALRFFKIFDIMTFLGAWQNTCHQNKLCLGSTIG